MTALLLIDIQNDYFPNGKFPLPEMKAVGLRCKNILNAARKNAAFLTALSMAQARVVPSAQLLHKKSLSDARRRAPLSSASC